MVNTIDVAKLEKVFFFMEIVQEHSVFEVLSNKRRQITFKT